MVELSSQQVSDHLELDLDDLDYVFALCDNLVAQQEYCQALALVNKALAQQSTPEKLCKKADVLFAKQDYSDALSLYKQALPGLASTPAPVLVKIVKCLYQQASYAPIPKIAATLPPGVAELDFTVLVARACFLNENLVQAKKILVPLVRQEHYAGALGLFACICLVEGGLAAAQTYALKAFALDNQCLDTKCALGMLKIQTGSLSDAYELLVAVRLALPSQTLALRGLAEIKQLQEEYGPAIAYWDELITQSAAPEAAKIAKAWCFLQLNELELAQEVFADVLAHNPASVDALDGQAVVAILQGDIVTAQDKLNAIVIYDKTHHRPCLAKILMQVVLNHHEAAEISLQALLAEHPNPVLDKLRQLLYKQVLAR